MRNGMYELRKGSQLDKISEVNCASCVAYYKNGVLHREDGPAVEWPNGAKEWHVNGMLHRVDGPAIETPEGDKLWSLNGQHHREDGPAFELADGTKQWWIHGVKLTEEELLNRLKK